MRFREQGKKIQSFRSTYYPAIKRSRQLIVALVASAAGMSGAQAQMMIKPYFGVGFTSAKHEIMGGATTVVTSSEGRKAAGKVFVGAEITPLFGVEAGHSRSKADHTFTRGGVAGNIPGTDETESRYTYVAAKATLPVDDQFSLFAKLGAMHTRDSVLSGGLGPRGGQSDQGVYVGIGGQYQITEKIGLRLEYERNGKKRKFGALPDAVTVAAIISF